jgi:hypothetical protein
VVAAVLRLALRTPAPPHVAFFRAPYERLFASKGLRQCVHAEDPGHKTSAAARARRTKPGAKRRQARAKQGARREDYVAGVGGSDVTKPPDANRISLTLTLALALTADAATEMG